MKRLFAALLLAAWGGTAQAEYSVVEASIADMQQAMASGRVTSRELVQQYLTRIALYDRKLRAVITVNPNVLREAEERDRERAQGKLSGPLHGIPIALKDNIHTTDMPTTGGALAFESFVPPYEATLVKSLRDAGAVIIAKTSMTELASWVAGPATPMPPGYNPISGFGMNPYDPRRDPRDGTLDGRPVMSPGGSSSGIGTAASFWAANVGTETSGSLLSPANLNMLVAIKPTVGRISRHGIMPLNLDQDTAGPMARTVADAATLLGALENAQPDPQDPVKTCTPPPNRDYTRFLDRDALAGARIGIPRAFYYQSVIPPGDQALSGGLYPDEIKAMAEAIAVLKQRGAFIVDPADIPSVVEKDPGRNYLHWKDCNGVSAQKSTDAGCSVVPQYGMKRDFNKWLASLGPRAPVKTLTELRQWNLAHVQAGALKYGQSQLDASDEIDVEIDRPRYEQDRAKNIALAAAHGIDEIMRAERLDALLFPGGFGASLSARAGYPTVIVPFAMVVYAPVLRSLPRRFDVKPSPFGVSFAGGACSEPRLIALAYAFEQATKWRIPPPSTP
jgi:amidase